MKKGRKTRWVVNEMKVLRNVIVISTIISSSMLIQKIIEKGITWISTIGYLG